MEFSTGKWVKILRIVFLTMGLCLLLAVTALIFFDHFTAAVLLVAFFFVAMALIAMFNFKFIQITANKEKLIVKYYSLFSIDREFNMIEFQTEQLRRVETRSYFLGLKLEIRFVIRVKKGLAEYPWISLSSVPIGARSKLIGSLCKLVPKNPVS